jgi:hypothetical protein
MESSETGAQGCFLIVLGLFAEAMALLAHRAARDFPPGSFTFLVWVLMAVAPIPIIIGVVLLVRRRDTDEPKTFTLRRRRTSAHGRRQRQGGDAS